MPGPPIFATPIDPAILQKLEDNTRPRLVVLDAARFPTQGAVRAFVASVEFEALSLACQATLESHEGLEDLPERLREMGRMAADFVFQDLTLLAQLAAQSDSEPYEAPRDGRAGMDSSRDWLRELLVFLVAGDLRDEYLEAFVRVIDFHAPTSGVPCLEIDRYYARGEAA